MSLTRFSEAVVYQNVAEAVFPTATEARLFMAAPQIVIAGLDGGAPMNVVATYAFNEETRALYAQDRESLVHRVVRIIPPEGVDARRLTDVVADARPRPLLVPATDPLLGTGETSDAAPRQWYHSRCNTRRLWHDTTGQDVIIAVIDWGFFTGHDDFNGRIDRVKNFMNFGSANGGGDLSHGTGSAGIAGAALNGRGIVGGAPDSLLWLLRAGLINQGSVAPEPDYDPWASAIAWAAGAQADRRVVILVEAQAADGTPVDQSPAISAAIEVAAGQGAIVCLPAGNGERSIDNLKGAKAETCVIVGATAYSADPRNLRLRDSNWGERISVSAPGDPRQDLTCAVNGSHTPFFGRTSGATAKVAATAALMLQVNPRLTPAQAISIFSSLPDGRIETETGRPCGRFLDSLEAVEAARTAKAAQALWWEKHP
ncbi:MAG TPA: S8 family serine peptidase [Thermoanaerobaculia bacterium]|jgi:subtilisin family serine protease